MADLDLVLSTLHHRMHRHVDLTTAVRSANLLEQQCGWRFTHCTTAGKVIAMLDVERRYRGTTTPAELN